MNVAIVISMLALILFQLLFLAINSTEIRLFGWVSVLAIALANVAIGMELQKWFDRKGY